MKNVLIGLALVGLFLTVRWSRPGEAGSLGQADVVPVPEVQSVVGEWVEAASWDFACGAYPGGWGWGEWGVQDGVLTLQAGETATYFLPIEHGGSFRLETEFQLLRGEGREHAGAHLGTQRRNPDTRTETGVFAFAGPRPARLEAAGTLERGSLRYAHLRHFVGQKKFLEAVDDLNEIDYGSWHVLALEVAAGRLAVYLDERLVEEFSEMANYSGPGRPRPGRPLPLAGPYFVPHLGVEAGVARFRHLKVFKPAPGLDAETARTGATPPAPPEPLASLSVPEPPDLSQFVRSWARAWSEQRVDDYLSFYSDDFVPQSGMTAERWRAQRHRRLTEPQFIRIEIDELESRNVTPDRAEVRFVQSYASDRYRDVVLKALVLTAENGTWLIVEERALPADRQDPGEGWMPIGTEEAPSSPRRTAAAPTGPPGDVSEVVEAWARARAEGRADDSLGFYGACFVPPSGMSRAEWREREMAGVAPPGPPALGGFELRSVGPGRAEASFVEPPLSLVLGIEEGQWKIFRELTGPARETDPVRPPWVRAMLWALYLIIFLICVYMARHYMFTLNRLFGRQRHPYLDVDLAQWPRVAALVPAHNEEAVIAQILTALLESDYPEGKLRIVAINDRSEDKTRQIIDDFATRHPDRITPFHREAGKPGKAEALKDAMETIDEDILVVFDADYIPGHGLIKQLVAPFFDPEVGAVMGRVVPFNVARNLLTRLLDLERAGGYQVDQQARMNLRLVPQYGGTAGAVRRTALLATGGWRLDSLAEDTDATMRLLLAGWKTVYQNRSECYEQVPETWDARFRQISRWARGHNQVLVNYVRRLLFNRNTSALEKLDGVLLLNIYVMAVVLLLGWILSTSLWFLGVIRPDLILILLVVSYGTLGNFAAFFEIAAATYLDGSRQRIALLPFVFAGFLVSIIAIAWATVSQPFRRSADGEVQWHKTEHKSESTQWI